MKVPEYFNKAVADKNKVDVEIVKKINKFFWNDVKRNMSHLTYPALYLKNLGTITVSRYKLNEEIRDLIGRIRGLRKSTRYTEKRKDLIMKDNLENLRNMLRMRNELITTVFNKSENNE